MHSSTQQAGESQPKQSSLSVSASASYGVIFGHLLIFIHPHSACLLACLLDLCPFAGYIMSVLCLLCLLYTGTGATCLLA
ncbi:hypothetical protein BDV11DRAFT_194611 [Aspergillus similis]